MAMTCLPMAAAAVVLLLMVATAQGIRLDAESKAALGNPVLNKSAEKGVVNKADGDEPSSGDEVEEAISEEKERAGGHRMPEIHVDYYGPKGHNARHH
ncbi:hypothetical protein CFC21_101377 [Triticum aestivum]|uniref:Uncharacterized protein n=3 Tax=Triticum TaxID=4564 RepID=A0A9R1BWA6_TRITD|nr:hypothetical protein CFC21_101377 [Triticum aestivum]VAI83384.1 unnamed protein product [Triticum turgidum subsp. durum]